MTHELSTSADDQPPASIFPPLRGIQELPASSPLVIQRFERQVEQTPAAIAVEWSGQHLTYQELNRRSNQLAHALQTRGVGPETLVGLYLERSLELLVGILGVLKAGGAYLPLDPGYPAERLDLIIKDSAMPLLLTQQSLPQPRPIDSTRVMYLDADWPEITQHSHENLPNLAQPDNAAYVIYTSGSTGQPKGVLVAHRALAQHCEGVQHSYGLTAEDRVLQFASLSFDASIEQVIPPLLVGARVVLRDRMLWDPAALYARIVEGQLTVVNLPTAYWYQVAQDWARSAELVRPQHLRLMIVGGDLLTPEAVACWQSTPLRSVRLLNAYGPTETTITAAVFDIPPDQSYSSRIPIGTPLARRAAYILNERLELLPAGFDGELYLGGIGLARGYLNAPDLTAEKFIPNPFSKTPGERLYQTGDRAYWRSDGVIEFLGRQDHQVKLRGYRIELGEIETVLRQHPNVGEALATIRPLGTSEKELVAYVVLHRDQGCDPSMLMTFLRERLPDYAIPRAIVVLEALPISPNGKVDRRALPAPNAAGYARPTASVAPRTSTEQLLAEIWQAILGITQVGIHDNFFVLGGHSLLATQVISRVQQTYQVSISITHLFDSPTVAQLAALIDQLRGAHRLAARSKIVPVPRQVCHLEE